MPKFRLKLVVKEPANEAEIDWGKVNVAFSPDRYAALKADVAAHLSAQELHVTDLFAGADERHRLNVRAISPNAWHSLFVHNMFIRPTREQLADFEPGFTILHAPEFEAVPEKHGTRSSTFIVLSFADRTVLIGGTRYAGEFVRSGTDARESNCE